MGKMKKILLSLVLAIGLGLGGLFTYLFTALPYEGYPEFEANNSEESIERGRYLANHVTVCVDCHSVRDWNYFSGPIVAGTEGKGGEVFDQSLGFPGAFVAKNITPTALSDWEDRDLARAITSGVSKDGTPFFPVMPYPSYSRLSSTDLAALVAYLRTLKPVENKVADSKPDFPMNLILRTIPGPHDPMEVDPEDEVAYGKYLVTIAGCADCHTPQEKGKKLPGMDLAGGFPFPLPDGSIVRSANITPDEETGIGSWDESVFVERFKQYEGEQARLQKVEPGQKNSYMPWTMYAGMKESDLKAMYAYLKTVKPVKNQVEVFTPVGR